MSYNNVEEYPYSHEVYSNGSSDNNTPSTSPEEVDSDVEYHSSGDEFDYSNIEIQSSSVFWKFFVFLFSTFWLVMKLFVFYLVVNAVWWHIYQSGLVSGVVTESDCALYKDTDLLYHLFC